MMTFAGCQELEKKARTLKKLDHILLTAGILSSNHARPPILPAKALLLYSNHEPASRASASAAAGKARKITINSARPWLVARKGCTTSHIALAWVASYGMIAITGTNKPKRLANWASSNVELTNEEKIT
ncbi:hypothetical protein S7711_11593 [Stachybotrys chartarum IBT 7711]|uniref:NADP-dependent oxidoreductase domain-containing protein n=1 Tax=Stachybotrys chartarum (strain CBS 109288 / IBT 7711) TaxID=1280523 RepID=A0A084AF40_STACB|nr:hypothetical protein S7711_11593 [Stachybotrys chartarum IBT 7711]